MRIDATGFVGDQAGSVASANAVLLLGLLRDHSIRFFTKPSFVDPRELILKTNELENLTLVDCTNRWVNKLRKVTASVPVFKHVTELADVRSYNRGLVRSMRRSNRNSHKANITLWMGDYVRGRVDGVPSVGYLQGPPATDARSIARHEDLISRLAGRACYRKLRVFSNWRMGMGYPDLSISDHLIVGSQWSRSDLIKSNRCQPDRVHAIPYPIDLNQFCPIGHSRDIRGPLKLLWLGRFVPRKRLDLFLEGMTIAIRGGCDVEAIVIGRSGFVPNYEQLLREFQYPKRLKHIPFIPRQEVPNILAEVDVMAQPSDDENFGSSVAESLACGVPVIVGATNGTRDYICDRSICLADDHPETMAEAIVELAKLKSEGHLQDSSPSRRVAERYFDPNTVIGTLNTILAKAAAITDR